MKIQNGIFTDKHPLDQSYEAPIRRSINMLRDLDGVRRSEGGTKEIKVFNSKRVIGKISLDYGETCLILDGQGKNTEIGILGEKGDFTTIIDDDLNIDPYSWIKGVFFKNYNQERIVIWVNDKQAIRYLNLDNLPFSMVGVKLQNIEDWKLSNLFIDSPTPNFKFSDYRDSGGSLTAGSYYFSIQYVLKDKSTTGYSEVFGPIMLSSDITGDGEAFNGSEDSVNTGKCIEFELSDLDEKYEEFNIVAIKRGTELKASLFKTEPLIGKSTYKIVYTGGETFEELSLEDVLLPKANYTSAKSITLSKNKVYLAGPKTKDSFDFQPYFNNVKVSWETSPVALTSVRGSFKDEVTIYSKRGLMPNEVYALFGRVQFKDGRKSDPFHIPGRAPGLVTADFSDGVNPDYSATFMEDASYASLKSTLGPNFAIDAALEIDAESKWFQMNDTAANFGLMGFWQNENESYSDKDSWLIKDASGNTTGTLSGKKVRHHRVPSLNRLTNMNLGFRNKGVGSISQDWLGSFVIDSNYDYQGLGSYSGECQEGAIAEVDFSSGHTITGNNLNTKGSWTGNTYTASVDQLLVFNGSFDYYLFSDIASGSVGNEIDTYRKYSVDFILEDSSGPAVVKESLLSLSEKFDYRGTVGTVDWGGDGEGWKSTYYDTVDLDCAFYLKAGQKLVIDGKANTETYYPIEGVSTCLMREAEARLTIDVNYATAEVPSNLDTVLPLLNRNLDDRFADSIGITFSNIVLPDSMIDEIDSVEFMYAKRTISNTLTAGQSALFFGSKSFTDSDEIGWYGGNELLQTGNNPFLEDGIGRIHAFDLMRNRPDITPSYITQECRITCTPVEVLHGEASAQVKQHGYFMDMVKSAGVHIVETKDKMRPIKGFQYLAPNSYTSLEGGTQINNTLGEESTIFEITHPNDPNRDYIAAQEGSRYGFAVNHQSFMHVPTGSGWTPDPGGSEYFISSLMMYKKDLYISLFDQELVSFIGKYKPNTSKEYSYVYGGDTFISPYGIRLTTARWKKGPSGWIARPASENDAVKNVFFFPSYSVSNIGLRLNGETNDENFYPNVDPNRGPEYIAWANREAGAAHSNTFLYNDSYSEVNDLSYATPFNPDVPLLSSFPYRIPSSTTYQEEEKTNSYRIFLANDFAEIDKSKGIITDIEDSNGNLLIQTEFALRITSGNIRMKTDAESIYAGSGNIFEIPPKEVISAKGGVAGSQHISSCISTKVGYVFIDENASTIYLTRENLENISSRGRHKFYMENLRLNLSEALKGLGELKQDCPHMPGQPGYLVGYDPYYNRLFVTKKDYKIKEGIQIKKVTNLSSSSSNAITVEDGRVKFFYNGRVVEVSNVNIGVFLEEDSYTYSYSFEDSMWYSEHTFIPDHYLETRKSIKTCKVNTVYSHDLKDSGTLYGKPYEVSVDTVLNTGGGANKVLASVGWKTVVETEKGKDFSKTFDKILVYSDMFNSGEVLLDPNSNIRNTKGYWFFNKFRDIISDHTLSHLDEKGELILSNLDPSMPWYKKRKFIHPWFIARLVLTPEPNKTIYLYEVKEESRLSPR